MKFVEIVEIVEGIEKKFVSLSDAKLSLIEALLVEGVDTTFDVVNHIDYLVEFVNAYSDENASVIVETVDCGKVLNIILDSARQNTTDTAAFISEAKKSVGDIDIDLLTEDSDEESVSVTLLSIVTNKLTEMLGEKAVEELPAEMVFDIVEATKALDISDDTIDMDIMSMVEEISTKLEAAITEGVIDLDSDDYDGETLYEFLEDYEDTDDLLEEMEKVNAEILSESDNVDGVRLMEKAKSSTVLLEGQRENCAKGDLKCMQLKAKNAKTYYRKHTMPAGTKPQDINVDSLSGKLGKHVRAAIKSFKKTHGKEPLKDYIQFMLIPGIIKRMRYKNKKVSAKANMKRSGEK